EPYLERRRHQHVASLYAAVFPRVGEDLILSLEDDVEAPLDAGRQLGEEIGYRSRGAVGVVAASYSMPVCVRRTTSPASNPPRRPDHVRDAAIGDGPVDAIL